MYTSNVSGPTYLDQKDSELKGIYGKDYLEDVNLPARKVLDRLEQKEYKVIGMAAIDYKLYWTFSSRNSMKN